MRDYFEEQHDMSEEESEDEEEYQELDDGSIDDFFTFNADAILGIYEELVDYRDNYCEFGFLSKLRPNDILDLMYLGPPPPTDGAVTAPDHHIYTTYKMACKYSEFQPSLEEYVNFCRTLSMKI